MNWRANHFLIGYAEIMFFWLIIQDRLSGFELRLLQWFWSNSEGELDVWTLFFSNSVIKLWHFDVINVGAHSELCWPLKVISGLFVSIQFLLWNVTAESLATRFHWSALESLWFEAVIIIFFVLCINRDLGWMLEEYFELWLVLLCVFFDFFILDLPTWRLLLWFSEVRHNWVLVLLTSHSRWSIEME